MNLFMESQPIIRRPQTVDRVDECEVMTTPIRVQNKCVLSTQTQLLGLELEGTLDTAQRSNKRDFDSWICNIDIRICKEKTTLWSMTWKPCAGCALRWTVNFLVHSHVPSFFVWKDGGGIPTTRKMKDPCPGCWLTVSPYATLTLGMNYRTRLKGGPQVWWTLLLLLLSTSTWLSLLQSFNLVPAS